MKAQLKRLGSDSAVYGISTILGRFLNFILVPFYTNFLPASDYGVVAAVYSYIAFMNIVFTFGLEPAFMRFHADTPPERRRILFSTPFWSITIIAVASAALLSAFPTALSSALLIPLQWSVIIPMAAATIAIDAINVIPFALLRMDRRAKYFASVRSVSIVINVTLNVLFVAVLRMSIEAIFLAGLISSLASTLLLVPVILRQIRPAIERSLLRALLAYGLPTVPSGLAAMAVQVVDRPLMQMLSDNATAGIYQANYKLGIFMMLIVSMFQYAWQPFYLGIASEENAPRIFSRVLTYFALVGVTVTLIVSFFIDDLIRVELFHHRTLIGREYWSGVGIVPIVLLAYLWLGMSMIIEAGLLIRKKTGRLPLVTGLAAVVNIAVNIIFIPRHGIYGGAFATLAAYVVMAVMYYIFTQRVYPVRYEFGRLARLFGAAIVVVVLWYTIPTPGIGAMLWKCLLLVGYAVLLVMFRFFEPREMQEIRALLSRFRR